MPARYQALGDYLAALPPETTAVTLTFPEIEAIVGTALPVGASTVSWWANSPSRGAVRPWRLAGWRAVRLRLRQMPASVTFVRADTTDEPTAPRRRTAADDVRQRRRGDPPIVDE